MYKNIILTGVALLLLFTSCKQNHQDSISDPVPEIPFVWENANLYFSNTESSGVLQGSYTEDGVFQQLMVMLDMLLGIPGIIR